MNDIQPGMGFKLDISGRDVACFLFALSLHSLLLLWKGGLLTLDNQPGGSMGETLVNVDFRSDIPSFDEQGGGAAPKNEGLLARMKSMIKGKSSTEEKPAMAMGNPTAPIEAPQDNWSKTEVLTNKAFANRKGFDGMANKKDALEVAKGQVKEVLVRPSEGNFQKSEPNLKENKFQLARKDMPFKIVSSKSRNELINVNAIAVNVGEKTTANVNSLDGGAGSGPALQSKAFASKGTNSSGGFSGLPAGTKGGSSSGAGLAMGSRGAGTMAGTGSGGVGAVGDSNGSETGLGSGKSFGNGSGTGSGSGTGGRSYASGSGFGSGPAGMGTLARNTVPVDTVSPGKKEPYKSGFNISGALANRPIMTKVLAVYEMDCRVSLRFRVDWSGKVVDGIIVEVSSGSPTFDQKVVAALQQWLFSKLPSDRSNEIQEGLITFMFKGV